MDNMVKVILGFIFSWAGLILLTWGVYSELSNN
jgi:hypothetical protein